MSSDSNSSNLISGIDPYDPLFLQNSDHSTLTLTSQVFDGSNYAEWRKSMRIALKARNKFCFIDGSYEEPQSGTAEHRRWEQVNNVIFSWLINGVDQQVRKSIIHSDSPRQIWDNLESRFGKLNGAQLFNLEQDLARISKGADSVAKYFTRIKSLWDELAAADSCVSLEDMRRREEVRRLFQFLMGLDDSYTSVRGSILMMEPLPSVDEALAILMQEEAQREIKAPVTFSETLASFHADNRKANSSQSSNSSNNQKNKKFVCTNCKKSGHTVDRCYFLIGFPKDYKGKKKLVAHVSDGSSTPTPSISPEQYQQLLDLLNRSTIQSIHGSTESSTARANFVGDTEFLKDENTKMFVQKVADHYSARTSQTLEEREASPIIHLKKLNNWIESVLIQLYARPGDVALDLACGKGGDLIKWDKAKVGYYVGIDITEGSVEDCRTRYNGDADHHQRRKKFSFPARLLCGDCFDVPLDKELADDAPFDIVSCQFAMHYSWSTETRARRALANVSALLRPGGIFIGTMPDANVIIKKLRQAEGLKFGNRVYSIQFNDEFAEKQFGSSRPFGIRYEFHLEDAVDCPEWIVSFPLFKTLAEEYDLELVFVKNSHAFVDEYLKRPEFVDLMRRLGALGDGNQDLSTISQDEWEVAYLCLAFVLRKRGEPDKTQRNKRRDRGKMHLRREDVQYI